MHFLFKSSEGQWMTTQLSFSFRVCYIKHLALCSGISVWGNFHDFRGHCDYLMMYKAKSIENFKDDILSQISLWVTFSLYFTLPPIFSILPNILGFNQNTCALALSWCCNELQWIGKQWRFKNRGLNNWKEHNYVCFLYNT